jgi:hypothetical protein
MKMLVCADDGYAQEVDADSFSDAVVAAFTAKLPFSIGEVMLVKEWTGKRFSKPGYRLTASVLDEIGATDIYQPLKGGFVLNTDSPSVRPVAAK